MFSPRISAKESDEFHSPTTSNRKVRNDLGDTPEKDENSKLEEDRKLMKFMNSLRPSVIQFAPPRNKKSYIVEPEIGPGPSSLLYSVDDNEEPTCCNNPLEDCDCKNCLTEKNIYELDLAAAKYWNEKNSGRAGNLRIRITENKEAKVKSKLLETARVAPFMKEHQLVAKVEPNSPSTLVESGKIIIIVTV